MVEKSLQNHWKLIIFLIGCFYLLTHLLALTKLPVFADEAIYIRWSQLIIDDWKQYFFFPLNDGKTPLQMWLMVPFIQFFNDPLFAGRLVTVIAGIIQVFVIKEIIRSLGGKKFAQLLGMMFVTILPFWFFFHRMALIDGLLTLFLSMALLGLIKLSQMEIEKFQEISPKFQVFSVVVIIGISFGLALLTKPSAVFFATVFPVSIIFHPFSKPWLETIFKRSMPVAIAGLIGLAIFFSLKLHPAFGQLFARGQDFSFTAQELLAGEWKSSLNNIRRVVEWNGEYISYSLVVVFISAVLLAREKRKYLVLLMAMLAFLAPFIMLGRVFHPRYALPMTIFTTVGAALFLEELLYKGYKNKKAGVLVVVLLFSPLLISVRFMLDSYLNPNALQLVPIDREQYLEEWSSGHGIYETVEYIEEAAKQGKVLVLTEGYFGTLPDGLLMYFHNRDVTNLEIQGIGAPVFRIPGEAQLKYDGVDEVLLVVNSHRMNLGQDESNEWQLIKSYPRPNGAPSLNIYQRSNRK